jgi:hypothetical protein
VNFFGPERVKWIDEFRTSTISGRTLQRYRKVKMKDPNGGKDLTIRGLQYEDEADGAYYKGHLVPRDPASAGLLGYVAKAAERPAILCRGSDMPDRPPHFMLRGRPLPKRYGHQNHKLHAPVPVPTVGPSLGASVNGPDHQ